MNSTRNLGIAIVLSSLVAAACAQQSLTRAEVAAETRAATAAGCIPHGDLDIAPCNGGPDDHPAVEARSTLTRAQVKAELAKAEAAGDVEVGDSSEAPAEEDPAAAPDAAQRVRDGEPAYAAN